MDAFQPSFQVLSPASGHFLGASMAPTYADVARGKCKVPLQEPGTCSKGKAKMQEGPSGPGPAVEVEGRSSGGFMADAGRAHPGHLVTAQQRRPPTSEGWQVVQKRKQWHRAARQQPRLRVGRCL
jgi:hypothetical protein